MAPNIYQPSFHQATPFNGYVYNRLYSGLSSSLPSRLAGITQPVSETQEKGHLFSTLTPGGFLRRNGR
jgi:hypothetical protein